MTGYETNFNDVGLCLLIYNSWDIVGEKAETEKRGKKIISFDQVAFEIIGICVEPQYDQLLWCVHVHAHTYI